MDTFLNIEPLAMEEAGIPKNSLEGKVAVITGSSQNIGLGYARAIAWAGAKVVLADINEEAGNEAARFINVENGEGTAIFVKTDVSKVEDIKNLAVQANAAFGKVDLLINNAMNMRLNHKILDASIEDLDMSYAISGRGVAAAIKEFVPGMIERGYGVVTYSSTQFHYCPPMVGGTVYCAGKAAATSVMMSLANEVKDTGVNVFCMVPAGVVRIDPSRIPVRPDGKPAEAPSFKMPGFNGMIPPEAGGTAMVYCILNAAKLHGSGIIINDAFEAMNFPYPNPDGVRKNESRKLTDMELTMAFCNMGPGFND